MLDGMENRLTRREHLGTRDGWQGSPASTCAAIVWCAVHPRSPAGDLVAPAARESPDCHGFWGNEWELPGSAAGLASSLALWATPPLPLAQWHATRTQRRNTKSHKG